MPTKVKSVWSYMAIPLILTAIALPTAFFFGGPTLAVAVLALIVMEVSLSFDNAVVNAQVLRNWDEKWRKIFLFWGILIAVFGMRLIFPIVVVGVAMGTPIQDWGSIVAMALNDPEQYHHQLEAVMHVIFGFGGAFLAMVGLAFFLDATKDTHWLGPIEGLLAKAGQIEAVNAAITLSVVVSIGLALAPALQLEFIVAGVAGIVLFVMVKGLGTIMGGGDEESDDKSAQVADVGSKFVRQGLMGFLYLELLDASFSFDGVVGAFAITSSLPWIMVGLGIGAFAVRELTIMAVDRGTLDEFKFLEHGAFYAIIALAGIMLWAPIQHVPEWFTGTISVTFIAIALVHSWLENEKEKREAKATATP